MKTWTMPRIAVDTFVPNEYTVSGCDYPEDAILLWSPIKETNGIEGWQSNPSSVPAGKTIDSNGINQEGITTVYGGTYKWIASDAYKDDDVNSYYQIDVGPEGRAVNESGATFGPGSVFYKNYGGGITSGSILPVEKNRS